jgi:hypothetical protein
MMKKLLLLLMISLAYTACGGGGGEDPPPTPVPTNKPPGTPTLSTPSNNLLCIDSEVQFGWSAATDPDGDSVSYEIQIATDNQFSQNLITRTSSTTSITISLNEGVAYYWRVKAVDTKNASSSYSATFNFYTEGEGIVNHLPFAPSVKSPVLDSVVQTESTTLEWEASDVDDDPLTFDVYFGKVNPPVTKIAENQSGMSVAVDLSPSTDYYWKIVVKDNNGGTTIGQVWKFKTD